jgi:hypothetical protein
MKVGQLIKKLQNFNPDLVLCDTPTPNSEAVENGLFLNFAVWTDSKNKKPSNKDCLLLLAVHEAENG